ncbi:MAG: T9SS type A sorting domain-containing protein, partial [Ignavibacteriaceae bacterium]
TNAWKFAMNAVGMNLKKGSGEDDALVNIPTEYGLDNNFPNPFNPGTTINYQLPEKNHVTLKVYDILGNLVTTLVDRELEAGYHSIDWNAGELASGVYIYRISSGTFVSAKKMILMK